MSDAEAITDFVEHAGFFYSLHELNLECCI